MHPEVRPESPQTDPGPEFAEALLAAATPQAVIAVLAQALPGDVVRAMWSPRWPEAIVS